MYCGINKLSGSHLSRSAFLESRKGNERNKNIVRLPLLVKEVLMEEPKLPLIKSAFFMGFNFGELLTYISSHQQKRNSEERRQGQFDQRKQKKQWENRAKKLRKVWWIASKNQNVF